MAWLCSYGRPANCPLDALGIKLPAKKGGVKAPCEEWPVKNKRITLPARNELRMNDQRRTLRLKATCEEGTVCVAAVRTPVFTRLCSELNTDGAKEERRRATGLERQAQNDRLRTSFCPRCSPLCSHTCVCSWLRATGSERPNLGAFCSSCAPFVHTSVWLPNPGSFCSLCRLFCSHMCGLLTLASLVQSVHDETSATLSHTINVSQFDMDNYEAGSSAPLRIYLEQSSAAWKSLELKNMTLAYGSVKRNTRSSVKSKQSSWSGEAKQRDSVRAVFAAFS